MEPKPASGSSLTVAHYNAAALYGFTLEEHAWKSASGKILVMVSRGNTKFSIAANATVDQWIDIFRRLNR